MPDPRDLLGAPLGRVLAPLVVLATVEPMPGTKPVENDADLNRLLPVTRLAARQLIRTGRVVPPLARPSPARRYRARDARSGLHGGTALGVLRQRGTLALQGRHQLAGQSAGDILMRRRS